MLHRLWTLIIKELQSLLRDPQTRSILVLPVILQVSLFPFAATLDVTNATIAIYSEDNGPHAIELTQRFAKAKSFSHVLMLHHSQDIAPTLDNQRALLILRFPPQFSRDIASGNSTSLQLILDGRRSNSAQIAANDVQHIVRDYQLELLAARPAQNAATQNHSNPNNSELVVRHWYNPNLDYKWFVVPSLIAMIATIGVLIVTALSVAREREQGTLEQLLVSPLSTSQIFIGKAIPALIVATFQATIVLLAGILIFHIPFAGSLLLFYTTMLIYGLSLVGFGLLISSLCSTQQQAFIGVFVFLMPAILLSGYVSPVENMPIWLQHITWVNPIRHFTDITKQIYLKDADFSIIWGSLWPLFIITLTTGSAAYAIFRRNIA
ncbi:ABC transporter permease [Pectobacterium carotovorum]|uniref:ABC transporter permease n=1 Tax=Pectobacterium carotovorum TaxID=554 RepID=UPI000503BEC7|nr:ABC transporter permease [Pectobacterium carotovorum]KFW99095.1 membrane protein [Pectobacterium carotovorum subsp. carotovorum]KML71097.1 membrane protein [Pectobacterium carotovorum subsp. carotovorum ICMP 5702]MBB1528385.1 ABC transporter permease [Pectobacterium carotovorum subsp. carotovorum]MCA6967628.1 ABC transporter permease [Pectobacterium carotovorum]MCH4990046.1 ABC transporter permease [Pectobacterium carotovorum]